MLLNLSILNFIIFEKIFIDFTEGFNVFTGETGAGKSIIIDSLNLLLGGKSNKNLVRNECEKAIIQGSFFINDYSGLIQILNENNIELEENTIIISREIFTNGRSTAKINGVLVNISFLKLISKYLLDIHGQYEQQSILNADEHIIILDKMCGNDLENVLINYQNIYKDFMKINKEVSLLEKNNLNKYERIDFLQFQVDELLSLSLSVEEEENLFVEYNILSNMNDIKLFVSNASNLLSAEQNSVLELMTQTLKSINKVAQFDNILMDFKTNLELIIDNTQELSYKLIDYVEEKDLDEERLEFLTARLDTINHIKRKYNLDVKEILEYIVKASDELKMLKHIDKTILNKKEEISKLTVILEKLSDDINKIRTQNAEIIEKEIESQLHYLNMKDSKFRIMVSKLDDFNILGKDSIHFAISTNPGMELMPLEKILSGGEVSRIMLAIKSIINRIDEVPTMIFDEIDTGISGKTAHLVGEKIRALSKTHQIICVTHSPQISSASDTHFKIEKIIDNNKTYSSIVKLDDRERIHEIARLLSGIDVTEISLKNAEEMISITK